MRRWHLGGAALLLAAGSIAGVGATTASASADPQGKPFDGANLKDGSVTYSKLDLADGDIPAAKVAGVLSQSALDQLAEDLTTGVDATNVRVDLLSTQVFTVRDRLEDLRIGLSSPSIGEGLVHWSQLLGMPTGFADGQDDVDGGAAADLICGSLCVSDAEIAEVSAHKIRGQIQPEQLAGGIDGQQIGDYSLTAVDLAGQYDSQGLEHQIGAVTSEKIADASVELRDLSPQVREWLPRITTATAGTPGNITVPAGQRAQLLLPAVGVVPGDFLSVAPPELSDPLLFAGARVHSPDQVLVWVFNTSTADVVLAGNWQVSWIDMTP